MRQQAGTACDHFPTRTLHAWRDFSHEVAPFLRPRQTYIFHPNTQVDERKYLTFS